PAPHQIHSLPLPDALPILTGLLGAFGILAALQARERTGRGQRVETSLLESMIGTMGFQAVRVLNGAGVPPPAGNFHPINAPYGADRKSTRLNSSHVAISYA